MQLLNDDVPDRAQLSHADVSLFPEQSRPRYLQRSQSTIAMPSSQSLPSLQHGEMSRVWLWQQQQQQQQQPAIRTEPMSGLGMQLSASGYMLPRQLSASGPAASADWRHLAPGSRMASSLASVSAPASREHVNQAQVLMMTAPLSGLAQPLSQSPYRGAGTLRPSKYESCPLAPDHNLPLQEGSSPDEQLHHFALPGSAARSRMSLRPSASMPAFYQGYALARPSTMELYTEPRVQPRPVGQQIPLGSLESPWISPNDMQPLSGLLIPPVRPSQPSTMPVLTRPAAQQDAAMLMAGSTQPIGFPAFHLSDGQQQQQQQQQPTIGPPVQWHATLEMQQQQPQRQASYRHLHYSMQQPQQTVSSAVSMQADTQQRDLASNDFMGFRAESSQAHPALDPLSWAMSLTQEVPAQLQAAWAAAAELPRWPISPAVGHPAQAAWAAPGPLSHPVRLAGQLASAAQLRQYFSDDSQVLASVKLDDLALDATESLWTDISDALVTALQVRREQALQKSFPMLVSRADVSHFSEKCMYDAV